MAEQAVVAPVPTHSAETGDKGLKSGALGFVSSVVIGVASTAPGYSLAASLGLVVAAVGLQAPAIMWIAFVPMLLVATAYYCMNRVDPDCGTTFTWATRALGPAAGVEVESRLVSGKPADALIEVAEEVGASAIVVGTVGENPVTGAILGSVVLRLVQRSPLPILVVPTEHSE
jgi:amino acid transporter